MCNPGASDSLHPEPHLSAEIPDDLRVPSRREELIRVPFPSDFERWRCLRKGPVSGRYYGPLVGLKRARYELDLRVDIDPIHANAPVMDRVSGDVYRVNEFRWIHRTLRWRVYEFSWIIESPQVTWSRCQVEIEGRVSFFGDPRPATTAVITIPWDTFKAAGPAVVEFTSRGVATYHCERRSRFFRDVQLEVDVAQSVNGGVVLPVYDTHAHDDRPGTLDRRNLDVRSSFAEAGLDLQVVHPSTVIDDSAADFNTWSPAELHDAMEGAFSQISGGWPKWHLWGLMCGSYQSSSVAGIMFDAAAVYGGAGEAPERQGFAVFRDHVWFDDLPAGAPADQTEAWALRQFLYTWVHEAGHAFNFVHSWNKGRADSLSWMNYPQNVTDFWDDFEFRFDDEELIHLRHGDRPSVIMGGDPWATGLHFHGQSRLGVAEGEPPLELLVRSKGYFELMEDVRVELRLRNLLRDFDVPIDARLEPRWGTVAIFVMKPDGSIEEFHPVFCEVGEPEIRWLKAGGSAGEDRFSHEVSLTFGRNGHVFSAPGEYRIRAVYAMAGMTVIPSAVHRVRVGVPQNRDEDRLAQDFFSFDAGLCLALGGSRSTHVQRGHETLTTVADRLSTTMAGARAAEVLANGLGRSFFAADRTNDEVVLREQAPRETESAVELLDGAIEVIQGDEAKRSLNVSLHSAVGRKAEILAEAGGEKEAKAAVTALVKDLEKRGVNPPVLDSIRSFGKSL